LEIRAHIQGLTKNWFNIDSKTGSKKTIDWDPSPRITVITVFVADRR